MFQYFSGACPAHFPTTFWRLGIAFLFVVVVGAFGTEATHGAEVQKDEPLPSMEAARTMRVPEGFQVQLFAGEPDVRQPISFAIDDRGRLWVAEAYNYPQHGATGGDRILILEDTNGDGTFDGKKVFYDRLNYVTGIEVGFSGVWVVSPPYFYFIADVNGDDQPDGEPVIILDGFGTHANAHNLANALAWGPDGWLYGTHGRTNWSLLGKPGTPEEERIRFDGGVYRYHPIRHEWEPFADGTTNPWGIDWNDHGQAFITNCVNPHLFHVIQGAHYEPWRNRASSRYAYERIPTIADHLHFSGGTNIRRNIGLEKENILGGGHAHCGVMVYLGDNWPQRYRNSLFTNNVHGRRINNDILRRSGSGYTASHGDDLLISEDPWFMGVLLRYGPAGEVYVLDWSDTGECHSTRNTRRHTGRIYRITYGEVTRPDVDLEQLSSAQLVDLQMHDNDWYVRHARRILQERANRPDAAMNPSHELLRQAFHSRSEIPKKLRALWALYATGGLDEEFLRKLLEDENEHLRSWAIRLLCDRDAPQDDVLSELARLGGEDPSSLVRLQLASAAQRIPANERWELVTALLSRDEDADDANLPLMTWYATEPLIEEDLLRFVRLAANCEIPKVRQFMARRASSLENPQVALDHLVEQLSHLPDTQAQADLLEGMLRGLKGRRNIDMPSGWTKVSEQLVMAGDAKVAESTLLLSLFFGDRHAVEQLKERVRDGRFSIEIRQRAAAALIESGEGDLAAFWWELLSDQTMEPSALRGLASSNEKSLAGKLIDRLDGLSIQGREDALQILSSRRPWARQLLDAIEKGKLPQGELSAFTVRQLYNLKDENLRERLRDIWGEIRPTDEAKRHRVAELHKQLTDDDFHDADLAEGRRLFQKTCAQCHRFFGEGQEVGPDITGSQRTNLEYLLQNIVDPSAAVSKDYQMQILETNSGRVITGLVVAETETTLTVQTLNEQLTLPRSEIAQSDLAQVSLMPDNLLVNLSREEIRNLFAYLAASAEHLQKAAAAP